MEENKKKNEKRVILEAKGICRTFKVGRKKLEVLKNVNIKVKEGEFIGLYGPSGSGKSTLLYILSLIDIPNKGDVIYNIKFNYKEYPYEFRAKYLGFVFQQYKLIPELTVIENVVLPNLLTIKKEKAIKKAKNLLKFLEIYELKDLYPHELSGGQQQRVTIARALLKDPIILFADEPTANLDVKNGLKIMELFKKINQELNTTIICVSHEEMHRKFFKRVIEMKDINQAL